MAKTMLALALGLAVLGTAVPGEARRGCGRAAGTRGCGNEIAACVTAACDGLSGREGRRCRRTCRREVRQACRGDETLCTASPSGAFAAD